MAVQLPILPFSDLKRLFNEFRYFSSKIVLSLFNAFAFFEANIFDNFDHTAKLFRDFCNMFLYGELVVLDIGLLKQAVFLIEGVDLPCGNLLFDRCGLCGSFRT